MSGGGKCPEGTCPRGNVRIPTGHTIERHGCNGRSVALLEAEGRRSTASAPILLCHITARRTVGGWANGRHKTRRRWRAVFDGDRARVRSFFSSATR